MVLILPVCWHELKAHYQLRKLFTDEEEREKRMQRKCLGLVANLSAWQKGEVTVAVFGIFKIHKKKKRIKDRKQNGVKADTSMKLLLCWKAFWSLTCGGHLTSSEVERLVPSSHSAAENKQTQELY